MSTSSLRPAPSRRARAGLLVAFVAGNVALQLVTAKLVKDAASVSMARPVVLGFLLLVILALASARFLVWGAMHKRYPLSLAYPASALFFPLVVLMAWLFGEQVTLTNVIGATLVTAGVGLSILGNPDEAPDP